MTDSVQGGAQVLVTWPDYDVDHPELGQQLASVGASIRLSPKTGKRTETELIAAATGCVAAIASTDPFSAAVLESLPDLAIICRTGVGTDSIDLDAATRLGIIVTVARGCNEEAVADHTLALMLACLRRVVQFDAHVRASGWTRTGATVGVDLHGKVCGLIGYGRIGRAVARRLAGFEVTVLVHDPALTDPTEHEMVTLSTLLARSDIVSVHVPLLSSTVGLLGATELAMMKPDAILISSSRGGVVDEPALAAALRGDVIRAAAVDVFEEEPPVRSPLLDVGDRVVLTPHIAGLTRESVFAMQRHATSAVATYLTGGWPDGVVNADASWEAQRRRHQVLVGAAAGTVPEIFQ